jgi:probable HAF family extracellular repeat protein
MHWVSTSVKAPSRTSRLKRLSRAARAILFVLVGLAAVVAARPTHAQVNYSVTDLGTLGGNSSDAEGINGSGQIVGNATTDGGRTEAFLYSNNSMQSLGILSGFSQSEALSLNNSGYVVGDSFNDNGTLQAFEWSATTGMVALPGASYSSQAHSINSSGQIAGWNGVSAVLFTSTGPQYLGSLQGGYNAAYAINDSGQVAGYSDTSSGAHAVQWNSGSAPVDLGTLSGSGTSDAFGINNAGQVVGYSRNASTQNLTPILSTPGQPLQSLGLPTGFVTGSADAINTGGQIVGNASTSAGIQHAFVYSGGSIVDLNTLISPSSGWTLNSATGINDSGQIVGTGVNAQGQTHAFLLSQTCSMQTVNRTPASIMNQQPSAAGVLEFYNPATGQFNGSFNPADPTVVLTHGFNTTSAAAAISTWNDLLSKIEGSNENIAIWDWHAKSGNLFEPSTLITATDQTIVEGQALAESLLSDSSSTYNLPIHFIGHSLGTMVNAEAIDTFTQSNHVAPIQDTLLDAADIANDFTSASVPNISPLPTSGISNVKFIDNYVSAVGPLLGSPLQPVTNVVLNHQPGNSVPVIPLVLGDPTSTALWSYWFYNAHPYAISWYAGTYLPANSSTAGYNWAIEQNNQGTNVGPSQTSYYLQSSTGGEYTVCPVTQSCAQKTLNWQQVNLNIAATELTIPLDAIRDIIGPIQSAYDNLVTTLVPSAPLGNDSTPVTTVNYTFTKQLVLSAEPQGTSKSAVTADDTPTSSGYSWTEIAIPTNATTMSFDFTLTGLSPGDSLVAGLDDNLLTAIESGSVADGVTTSSGMIDVSEWAGQDAELFLGLITADNDNLGGTATVDNIMFSTTPEPGAGLFLLATCSIFGLRRRRSRHCDEFTLADAAVCVGAEPR